MNPPASVPARIPCRFCGEEILESAVKCRHCNEFFDGRSSSAGNPQPAAVAPSVNVQVVQHVTTARERRWNPGIAILLSFIIPGAGQMYKGQPLNGVAWFVITAIGYFCFIVPGVVLHLLCMIGAGMGDPYR